jgi:hypothetical protein
MAAARKWAFVNDASTQRAGRGLAQEHILAYDRDQPDRGAFAFEAAKYP